MRHVHRESTWVALFVTLTMGLGVGFARGDEPPSHPEWKYRADALRPFWRGTVMEGESVLFIRDEESSSLETKSDAKRDPAAGVARAKVLFPIEKVLSAKNSSGEVEYEEGRDFVWKAGSREIVLPAGSRIVSRLPSEMRRPAKSQKYELTHRDGNGEIFFGGQLEYHEMQTCFTYVHAENLWSKETPTFDPLALPKTIEKLHSGKPTKIVTLGDSISAGCNASGWAGGAPYQPAYPELLSKHLSERFGTPVESANLSLGGADSAWGVSMVEKVAEAEPDLVLLAFGMNDSAGRAAADYKANTAAMVERIRERLPNVEFVLIATMLGNRDWIRLRHESFPEFRDALLELRAPGVAVADLTSIWTGFLEHKLDWDQTGNGVNHPNDWGHRVYVQAISALLIPEEKP